MTGRFDNSSLTLVAFRGLWDKFAPPCSIGAYRRSYLKGIPLLLDPKLSGITLGDIVDNGTTRPGTIPLFVIADALETVEKTLANQRDLDSLFVVIRTETSPFSIYAMESGKPVMCGLYLTLTALLAGQYPVNELGKAMIVLFESIDTQLTLTGKRSCWSLDDTNIEKRLISVIPPQAILYKVSDLVERELLIRGSGRNF